MRVARPLDFLDLLGPEPEQRRALVGERDRIALRAERFWDDDRRAEADEIAARTDSTRSPYVVRSTPASQGDRHLPISARAHAVSDGLAGRRPPHCRMGNASWRASTQVWAVRLEEKGPR